VDATVTAKNIVATMFHLLFSMFVYSSGIISTKLINIGVVKKFGGLLKEKLKDVLVAAGWGVTMASIILQSLYQEATLAWLGYLFIFVVAVLAGLVLVDVEKIVYGLLLSILLSVFIMFFCLTLPATLGKVGRFAPLEAFYGGVVVMVFRSLFPITIILSFLGSFVGGLIGEKFGVR